MTQDYKDDQYHSYLLAQSLRGKRHLLKNERHYNELCNCRYWLFAFIILLTTSGKSVAQETLVIDISVFGLNVNQSVAIDQIGSACSAVAGVTPSADSQALLDLCTQIDALDPGNPEDARQLADIADTVAVEEFFALNDSLVATSDFQTTNVRARLDALRHQYDEAEDEDNEEQDADTSSALSLQESGGAASGDLIPRLGGFINGHTSTGDFDGGRLQQDSDISSNSLTVGADYRINDSFVVGLGLGLAQDVTQFTRVAGGVDSDGLNITAFASWYEGARGYLDFILDLGQTDFEIERPVSFDPARPNSARSSPASSTTTMTVSAGRNFRPFDWDLGGYFRLSHAQASVDSFSETATGDSTDFVPLYSIDSQSIVSTRMVLGFELSKSINTQMAVLIPVLRLEYVKENELEKDEIEATLIATGTAARYTAERRVSSYSNMGIGASAVFAKGKSAYAFYETHLQHDLIRQDWLKLGLRLEF